MAEEFITIGIGGVTGVYYPTGDVVHHRHPPAYKGAGVRDAIERVRARP
ncbi:hypothetical protein HPQ64_14940 [Rhizobiales bacterium]|nr:hypothetical protein [Hongsoonwoonella zoysiae]